MSKLVNLTVVVPYYDNPMMLSLQYATWAAYNESYKGHINIVIVDDGTQQPEGVPAALVARPPGLPRLSILRHLEDKPWHQHAARNTGAKFADGEWLLLTDMDHIMTDAQMSKLMNTLRYLSRGRSPTKDIFFMLDRREPDGTQTLNDRGEPKPHPNSFVMKRSTYWDIGGYDEALCGIYGTDSDFRSRCKAKASYFFLSSCHLTRYSRLLIPDASTRTMARKEGRDANAKARVYADKKRRGVVGPETGTMEWAQVV